MMKHMIFHGIPHMTTPSEEQVEQIQNRDRGINPNEDTRITPQQVQEQTAPLGITPDLLKAGEQDAGFMRGTARRWIRGNCELQQVAGHRRSMYVCDL